MNIEVKAEVTYTVYLSDEDVAKVKAYLEEHEDETPSWDLKENIAWAVDCLYRSGEIDLYDDGKYTESDFSTEQVSWSNYEDRDPEEILRGDE